MLFIPAIDLIDGRCVRLTQGNYAKMSQYTNDPVDMAISFQDQGARFLHIIDLDAAIDPEMGNREVIRRIVDAVAVPVEVGGGVRNREDVKILLDMGVTRVILGTIIVKNEETVRELIEEFDERLVAGIDAKNGIVRVSGWREGTTLEAVELGKRVKDMGFSLVIYTDISKDGMLEGPNFRGVRSMALETGLPVIAAGGISSIEDIRSLKDLASIGVVGVISGKAIYEGRISVPEACGLLQNL